MGKHKKSDKLIKLDLDYNDTDAKSIKDALIEHYFECAEINRKFRPNDDLKSVYVSQVVEVRDVLGKMEIFFVFRHNGSSVKILPEQINRVAYQALGKEVPPIPTKKTKKQIKKEEDEEKHKRINELATDYVESGKQERDRKRKKPEPAPSVVSDVVSEMSEAEMNTPPVNEDDMEAELLGDEDAELLDADFDDVETDKEEEDGADAVEPINTVPPIKFTSRQPVEPVDTEIPVIDGDDYANSAYDNLAYEFKLYKRNQKNPKEKDLSAEGLISRSGLGDLVSMNSIVGFCVGILTAKVLR